MWLFTSGSFISVVHKGCKADELIVRGRRESDIKALFPDAKIRKTIGNDYLFRATVKRSDVAAAMTRYINELNYSNYKDSIRDDELHHAAHSVWHAMSRIQPIPPYSRGRGRQGSLV